MSIMDQSQCKTNLEISPAVPMCMSSACAVHVQLLQGTLKTVCSPESCLSWNISEIAPDPFRLANHLLISLAPLFLIKKINKNHKTRPKRLREHGGKFDARPALGARSQYQGADPQSFDLSRTALAEMDHPKCEKAPGPRTRTRTCILHVYLKNLEHNMIYIIIHTHNIPLVEENVYCGYIY